MVPFHTLHIVSYCAIVTLSLTFSLLTLRSEGFSDHRAVLDPSRRRVTRLVQLTAEASWHALEMYITNRYG